MLIPCTGFIVGQDEISRPVGGTGTWRFICLFFSALSLQPSAWLTFWIIQTIVKAWGKSDHSCLLLVKHRLVSWELKYFGLIETFRFNIWAYLLKYKDLRWAEVTRGDRMVQCLGGLRGKSCLRFSKRQRWNGLQRALNRRQTQEKQRQRAAGRRKLVWPKDMARQPLQSHFEWIWMIRFH